MFRDRCHGVATPSSVAASAATGTIERPRATSGPRCRSRLSLPRLTAITVAPASATMRVTVVPIPPPARAGYHNDAAVEAQEIVGYEKE